MEDAPFMSIGNDELEGRPEIHQGDELVCHLCGGSHIVQSTTGKTVNREDMQSSELNNVSTFEYFECDESGKTVLVGVDNVLLPRKQKD